jgi:hypothetical protein
MTLQTGDILLVKVGKFRTWYRWLLAKLIQLIDRNYYHHCAIYVDGLIHEADSVGVIERTIHWYQHDTVCVLRPIEPLTPPETFKYLQAAREQLGKPYDYWGTLLFQLIYRLTFKWLWLGKTHASAGKKLYCSEHCLMPIHKVRGYFNAPWKVSPGDIKRSSGYYKVVWEGKLLG